MKLIKILPNSSDNNNVFMACPTYNTPCGVAEYTKLLSYYVGCNVGKDIIPEDLNKVLDKCIKVFHLQYHSGMGVSQIILSNLSKYLKEKKIRLVITPHSEEFVGVWSNTADVIILHNSLNITKLRNMYRNSIIKVVPHPILKTIPTTGWAKTLVRKGSPTVLTTGFLLPHKRVLEIIKCIELLRNKYPDILLICANNTSRDSEISYRYYIECSNYVRDRNLPVIFFTDFLPYGTINALANISDVGILFYKNCNDFSSGVANMLMGTGLPLVVSDSAIFKDLPISIVSKCKSIQELSIAIHNLISNKGTLEGVKSLQINFVNSHSFETLSKKLVEIYNDLI